MHSDQNFFRKNGYLLKKNLINKKTIDKINNTDIRKLPKISDEIRIGPCVSNPQKFNDYTRT